MRNGGANELHKNNRDHSIVGINADQIVWFKEHTAQNGTHTQLYFTPTEEHVHSVIETPVEIRDKANQA
jgi:hypothetical protein